MLAVPKCYTRRCKHYEGVKWLGDEEASEVNWCPAFPDGIPDDIAYDNNRHLTPIPEQVGAWVFEEQ